MDPEYIRELFSEFGPVQVRRMFGGAGIAADGVNFAIVFDGVVYLKVDETTIPDFEREGSVPFVYPLAKNPRRVGRHSSSYWRLPERLYDDPDDLAQWARNALSIARRGAERKTVKSRTQKRR